MLKTVFAGIVSVCVVCSVRGEVPVTAQDTAVDSDVILESAVREIKSAPRDTVNVIGDGAKLVGDELSTTAKGVKAAFSGASEREKTEKEGLLEVADAWNSSNDILYRSYRVDKAVGNELAHGQTGTVINVAEVFAGVEFPPGTSAYYRPEIKKLFVRQTLPNLLSIEDFLGELHNGIRELMGHQVEIEAKFVEVSQSTLDDLGFNWTFNGKNGGNAKLFENLSLPPQDILSGGIRTASSALGVSTASDTLTVTKTAGSLRWNMVIQALEQSDDTDVLSAPKIVTRDGNTATIQIGEDRMVPKRFDATSANTSVYVQHSDWDSELIGVQMEVTPELRADDLIDLELKPKVMDLIGYDDYQVSPDAKLWPIHGATLSGAQQGGRFPVITRTVDGAMNAVGELYSTILKGAYNTTNEVDINNLKTVADGTGADTAYRAPQYNYYTPLRDWTADELIQVPAIHGDLPYFRIREMETQVTVADGSTIGMGGLVYEKLETYKDKVPVLGSIPLLGRLFRSEGEKNIKRNLMIFVTAEQVDINGHRSSELALSDSSNYK